MATPGPGSYKIAGKPLRDLRAKKSMQVNCCLNGHPSCCSCKVVFSLEDYYRYGRKNWCRQCFHKTKEDSALKALASKARNCYFFHDHQVPKSVKPTTSAEQIRHLNKWENIMWLKFGEDDDDES